MVSRSSVHSLGQSSLLTFEVGSLAEPLQVVRFSGSEGISSLFEFQVDVASENQHIDFADVVGRPALLTIVGELEPRHLHGMVSRFEQINELPRYALYRAREGNSAIPTNSPVYLRRYPTVQLG